MTRCAWAQGEYLIPYHDREWGVPVHDEGKLFEFLVLDGFQAGLSWEIVLKKREALRRALAGFDPDQVAAFGPGDQARLLGNPEIIRNRLKIKAAVTNARAVVDLRREGGLDKLLWSLVKDRTIHNHWSTPERIPAETRESRNMSKELKNRGFKFVGPTICYAVMQSAGLVNDHLAGCFRHRELMEGEG